MIFHILAILFWIVLSCKQKLKLVLFTVKVFKIIVTM